MTQEAQQRETRIQYNPLQEEVLQELFDNTLKF